MRKIMTLKVCSQTIRYCCDIEPKTHECLREYGARSNDYDGVNFKYGLESKKGLIVIIDDEAN